MRDPSPYLGQRAPDEIDIVHYLSILRKRAVLISILSIAGLVLALSGSLLMEDRFQAKAVISPVKEGGGAPAGLSVLVQQLESVPGMSLSSPSSAPEILALLNSNMLRQRAIEQYDLLPVIFNKRWDREKKDWTAGESQPTVHDALRALERIISVRHSPKDNTITITVESATPDGAASMISNLLSVLNTHLSGEARRIADSNRRYLEGQLKYTSDPLIRQNIYALIAQQIESSMMAGVMENFAFKVIDPPVAPDMKSSPDRRLIAIAGFIGSLSAAVLLAFVLEYFKARRGKENHGGNNKTMRSDTEIE
jgi:uncharacterized protein involved in exopolysaccharide biosynthesis